MAALFFLFLLILVPVGLGLLVALIWYLAVQSRHTYKCSECNQTFKDLEYINPSYCNICGGDLERVGNQNGR